MEVFFFVLPSLTEPDKAMLVLGEDGSWSLRVEWIYDGRLGECMVRWLQVPCWMMPRFWLFDEVVMPVLVERRPFMGSLFEIQTRISSHCNMYIENYI